MIAPDKIVDALCTQTDPELFFPEQSQSNKVAKSICAKCPISLDCLEDALNLIPEEDFGIWGGTSARERSVLRKNDGMLANLREALAIRDQQNREELELEVIVRHRR